MWRLVDLLLVVGAASLIYYKRVTEGGALTGESIRYRSDFVFFAAVSLAIIAGVFGLLRGPRMRLTQTERIVFCALTSYLMFSIIATLISVVVYNLRFDLIGLGNFSKTVLGIALSVVTYVRLQENRALYKWLAAALYLPPAITLVIGAAYLVSPGVYWTVIEDPSTVYTQASLLSDAYRFQGLATNPFHVLISSSVAIGFLWPLMIDRVFKRHLIVASIGFSYIIGLVFLIFWTMTRTGVLVLLFVLACAGILTLYNMKRTALKLLLALPIGVLLIVIAWALMPAEFAEMYTARFYSKDVRVGQWEYYTGGRIEIWKYFAEVAIAHPLGVGFNFEQRFFIDSSYQEKLNPHSVLLMAWMFGGIGGFASMMIAVWAVLRSIVMQIWRGCGAAGFLYYVGAVSGLLGTWIPFWGPSFHDFTHGILFAMVLSGVPATDRIAATTQREPVAVTPRAGRLVAG